MCGSRNDGIGRNRSDTSGFFAPLNCESFGYRRRRFSEGNAMTDETLTVVVAPKDLLGDVCVVVITSIFIEGGIEKEKRRYPK